MNAHIRRLLTKLQALVTRGVITRTNDDDATQTIQVELRFDEVADMIEHFQPFGLSFRPTSDSEVIVLAVGSSSDNLVALAATDRSIRPTGIDEEGEGGLYTPSGWKVFCNADGEVNIGEKVAADFLALAQKVNAELDDIRTAFDAHTHEHSLGPGTTKTPTKPLGGPSGSVAAEKAKGT